jgi:hypothetical protein
MATVHPVFERKPFDPAVCATMGLAFDTAWQKLLVSGTPIASSPYASATREALAIHIVDLAKTGERDVNRLRDDAVAFILDTRRGPRTAASTPPAAR